MNRESDREGDQLLHGLARVARDDEERAAALEERWLALNEGLLSVEEEESFLRDAMDGDATEPEDLKRAAKLFRPLGEDFRASMAQLVEAELCRDDEVGTLGTIVAQDDRVASPAGVATEEAPTAQVSHRRSPALRRTPRSSRRHSRLFQAAGVLAAAALIAVIALDRFRPSALPPYELQWEGGVRSHRASEKPADRTLPELAAGTELRLDLTPEQEVQGEVFVHLFVERHGSIRRWQGGTVQIVETGAARITIGPDRELDLSPGLWTVVVVVGRSPRPPDSQQIVALREADGSAEVSRRLVEQRMRVLDDP